MASQWVNKYAIMRDLSLAQGCVPVDLAGTVEAGDTPPAQNFNEDTEEDFYRSWVGGNGDYSPPDLGLIKHMLEVVRNHDVPTQEEVELEKMIQISKLNPHCSEFHPKLLDSGDKKPKLLSALKPQPILEPQPTNTITKPNPKSVKPKKKETRNVAVQSLLENMKNEIVTENKESVNILIPTHLTNNTNNIKGIKKVSGWLGTHENKPTEPTKKNDNILQLDLDPMSMFKKKTSSNVIVPKPVKEVKRTSPYNYGKYVPSNNAAQYYKRFLECSRMKEMVQENVWTKVERQMKEIDERRAAEAELFALSLALYHDDPIKYKLDQVYLPSHRHALQSPCRVCEIAAAHSLNLTPPTHTVANQHEQTVHDPWRIQNNEDETKNVDDWRKERKTCDYEEFAPDCEIENDKSDTTIVDNPDESRNETKFIDDTRIQSWRSKPKVKGNETPEPKVSEIQGNDSNNTETTDSWASLDDDDEIDAWRFEILGDEDDQYNEFHQASETVDETLKNPDGSSWRNYNKRVKITDDDNVKTMKVILSKNEDQLENKLVTNNHAASEIQQENKMHSVNKFKKYDNFGLDNANIQCKSIKDLKTQLTIANKKDGDVSFEFEITKPYLTDTNSVKYRTDSQSYQLEIKKSTEEHDKNKNMFDGDCYDDYGTPVSRDTHLEIENLSDTDDMN